MSLELAHYYEHIRKDSPFTHSLQTKIPSLGTYFGGLRVPDLLLTTLYRIDARTGNLVHNVKLIFQPDGPSDAQLNFKHETLIPNYKFRVYSFKVNVDVLFGEGVTKKIGGNLGANIGAEKGGVEGGVEASRESPGTRTTVHGLMHGLLSAHENRLEAWGEVV